MNTNRMIATVFLVAGLGALATSAVTWRRAGADAAALSAERATRQTQLDSTRADLRAVGIRYRGFVQGMDAVPDSVRRFGGGIILEQSRIYQKTIQTLEGSEAAQVRMLGTLDERIASVYTRRRRNALPLSAVGVVLAGAGAGMLLSRRRPLAT
ncbi:MAG TPA: hypothetical protein VFX92_10965 [Candidatus Krumholzibacteria bacterium]|nr:hypothetical protein [Candidatus Krumholzibacteria bacterium]